MCYPCLITRLNVATRSSTTDRWEAKGDGFVNIGYALSAELLLSVVYALSAELWESKRIGLQC